MNEGTRNLSLLVLLSAMILIATAPWTRMSGVALAACGLLILLLQALVRDGESRFPRRGRRPTRLSRH